ncbi:MAG: hypothetical protein AAB548_01865 [Patescibacteria group bacterium]
MKATKYIVDGRMKLTLNDKRVIESRVNADAKVSQSVMARDTWLSKV